jgi:hypothetical protein
MYTPTRPQADAGQVQSDGICDETGVGAPAEHSGGEPDIYALNLAREGGLAAPHPGLLELSRQQRNLLLLRPLFQLELNKLRIGVESNGDQGLFSGIDTHYLVLSLLDFMMEGTTMNMGCTQTEVLGHVAAIAQEMKPELTAGLSARVAEVVLDTLDNKANAYREFSFDFFDATTKTLKPMRFRLVTYEPDLEDVYRYRPTSEGYLVYLGMLDLSPEDSQELMEKMLDLLVQRGRFEAALEIAKRARKLSIEYRQLIQDRLLQAYRAPGSVNWTKEMATKLDAARIHVRGRQNEDQRMEDAVREALLKAEEPKTRQDLAQLLKTLQSAGIVRSNLVNDITVAPEKFLEAQRSVFRARRPSGLPDLETRLFPQILGLSAEVLTDNADYCISAFYPPVWPKVYDLNATFALLLERRPEGVEPEDDDGEIAPFVPLPDQFPRELIAAVEDWLKQRFSTGGSFRIDELLELAEEEGLNSQMRRCMVLMLFRSFAQSESIFPGMHSDAAGRFSLDIAQGTNLVFSPTGEE